VAAHPSGAGQSPHSSGSGAPTWPAPSTTAGPPLIRGEARNAQEMYDELGEDGKRKYTVAEIATAYGVTRPTIYRYLTAARDHNAVAR